MNSSDSYAVKAHELMKKAQKTNKGKDSINKGSFISNLTSNKSERA